MNKEEMEISLNARSPEILKEEKLPFSDNSLAKILKREENYRFFAERTGRMFFYADLEKKEIEWAGAIKDVTGYDAEEFEKISLGAFKGLLHPEDGERISQLINSSPKTEERIEEEYRFRRKDGNYVYVETNVIFLKDARGHPYRLLGFLKDITGKVLFRQKIERDSEKFLHVAKQTGQLILDWDARTNKIEWAGAIEEITGYTQEEFAEVDLLACRKIIHPDDMKRAWIALKHSLKTGENFYQEFRFRKKDGSYIYVEDSSIVLKDEKGRVYRALGVIKDITEKKQSQEELRKSEERYRFIAEQTGKIVYDYCVEKGKLNYAGPSEKIIGYTPEELSEGGVDFWIEHVHPEEREEALKIHQKLLETGETVRKEYRFRKKEGCYVYLEEHAVVLRNEQDQVCKVLGVLKDVTEKYLAEENIKRDEEIRKKEIHHRIKNNLQVISSLLDLQAEKFTSREVVEAFRESQNRVRSMAMIHEELYKSRDMETLDFTAYLQKLAKELFRSYDVGTYKINLDLAAEDNIFLGMDTAIPLGIIINELVSNSLKHAFSDGRRGEVRINFHSKENPEENPQNEGNPGLMLVISDNGSGLPENIDINNSDSLGLQLVTTLVEQIEGEIELQREQGTEFRIGFGKK
jgi:PAS domain S-box-containing protein